MIVADASAIVDVVAGSEHRDRALVVLGRGSPLAAPELMPVEVVSALSRMARAGVLSAERASTAVRTLGDLPVHLFRHEGLVDRAFGLSARFTVYDAVYVALAEVLDATLVTRDARLARQAASLVAVEHIAADG